MVRWNADADRLLLIAILNGVPVQLGPDAVAKVAAAFPPDPRTGERPTPKAITERLSRIKSLMKQFGSAEPRPAKKGSGTRAIEAGRNASVKSYDSQKPRALKVSKDSVTKSNRGKKKARTGTISDEDDDEFIPGRRIPTREAQSLARENPDFSRYGKEASPSRKRAKKDVHYSEESFIKDEPHSEDDESVEDDVPNTSVESELSSLHEIDTTVAKAYAHQDLSAQPEHDDHGATAQNGALSYEYPMASQPTISSYPADYSLPAVSPQVVTTFEMNPGRAFSSPQVTPAFGMNSNFSVPASQSSSAFNSNYSLPHPYTVTRSSSDIGLYQPLQPPVGLHHSDTFPFMAQHNAPKHIGALSGIGIDLPCNYNNSFSSYDTAASVTTSECPSTVFSHNSSFSIPNELSAPMTPSTPPKSAKQIPTPDNSPPHADTDQGRSGANAEHKVLKTEDILGLDQLTHDYFGANNFHASTLCTESPCFSSTLMPLVSSMETTSYIPTALAGDHGEFEFGFSNGF